MRIALSDFGAIAPAFGSRQLPENMAVTSDNLDLRYRYLRSFNSPGTAVNTVSSSTKRSFHLMGDDGTDKWLSFPDINADLAKGPVLEDTHERYYWLDPDAAGGTGYLRVGAYADIDTAEASMVLGTDYFKAGVPAPRTAATLGHTGGSAPNETRYYTYTFVNSFNEEGAPAPPVSHTGPPDATWNLTAMDVGAAYAAFTGRAITKMRIYRTIPAVSGTTVFYLVAEQNLQATYNDTQTDTVVASNNILDSTYWNMPPGDLDGFVITDNGFIVAWKDRNVYVSEAYRPHAYPPQYYRSTEYPIIGAGVFGSYIIVCTTSTPYLLSGTNPAALSFTKFSTAEPCLFKRSIVTMPYGVVYASPNGIALVSNQGVKVLTSEIITDLQWQAYVQADFVACRFYNRYMAFHSTTRGIMFNPEDAARGFTTITSAEPVNGLEEDPTTADVYVIAGTEVVPFADDTTEKEIYRWRSKVFNLGEADNIGAIQFDLATAQLSGSSSYLLTAAQLAFNASLFSNLPVAAFGTTLFGGYSQHPLVVGGPSYHLPFGGNQAYLLSYLSVPDGFVYIKLYADDELVGAYDITSIDTRKTASGMKRQNWQFEVVGNVDVYEIKLGTSTKALKAV